MSADDKDRLGKKLHEKEHAEEERYFAAREKEALHKLRAKEGSAGRAVEARCPRCGDPLREVKHHGVPVEECPAGDGMWLDRGEAELIASRERDSWLGRLFHLPKPRV